MSKTKLRNEMLEKMNSLSNLYKEQASKSAISKLIAIPEYIESEVIFAFVSFNSEINTHDFIKNSLMNGKKVLIPHVYAKEKIMKPVILTDFKDLIKGHYGILSLPNDKLEFYEGKIDLVLTPGVLFDKNFYRIGYGAGYYDKFFSLNFCANKIGLCYDFQLRDNILKDEHDIPLDMIITDKRIIERNK